MRPLSSFSSSTPPSCMPQCTGWGRHIQPMCSADAHTSPTHAVSAHLCVYWSGRVPYMQCGTLTWLNEHLSTSFSTRKATEPISSSATPTNVLGSRMGCDNRCHKVTGTTLTAIYTKYIMVSPPPKSEREALTFIPFTAASRAAISCGT